MIREIVAIISLINVYDCLAAGHDDLAIELRSSDNNKEERVPSSHDELVAEPENNLNKKKTIAIDNTVNQSPNLDDHAENDLSCTKDSTVKIDTFTYSNLTTNTKTSFHMSGLESDLDVVAISPPSDSFVESSANDISFGTVVQTICSDNDNGLSFDEEEATELSKNHCKEHLPGDSASQTQNVSVSQPLGLVLNNSNQETVQDENREIGQSPVLPTRSPSSNDKMENTKEITSAEEAPSMLLNLLEKGVTECDSLTSPPSNEKLEGRDEVVIVDNEVAADTASSEEIEEAVASNEVTLPDVKAIKASVENTEPVPLVDSVSVQKIMLVTTEAKTSIEDISNLLPDIRLQEAKTALNETSIKHSSGNEKSVHEATKHVGEPKVATLSSWEHDDDLSMDSDADSPLVSPVTMPMKSPRPEASITTLLPAVLQKEDHIPNSVSGEMRIGENLSSDYGDGLHEEHTVGGRQFNFDDEHIMSPTASPGSGTIIEQSTPRTKRPTSIPRLSQNSPVRVRSPYQGYRKTSIQVPSPLRSLSKTPPRPSNSIARISQNSPVRVRSPYQGHRKTSVKMPSPLRNISMTPPLSSKSKADLVQKSASPFTRKTPDNQSIKSSLIINSDVSAGSWRSEQNTPKSIPWDEKEKSRPRNDNLSRLRAGRIARVDSGKKNRKDRTTAPKHFCVSKWDPYLHDEKAGCERCLTLCSTKEREDFFKYGRHQRVARTSGGCNSRCNRYAGERFYQDASSAVLCRICFHAVHRKSHAVRKDPTSRSLSSEYLAEDKTNRN